MTEDEWLDTTFPLYKLIQHAHVTFSERKIRLFTLACLRRIDHLITDERRRRAVECVANMAERGAAGRRGRPAVQREALEAASDAARRAAEVEEGQDSASIRALQAQNGAAWCAWSAVHAHANRQTHNALIHAAFAMAYTRCEPTQAEEAHQRLLLFDIFGNPFRPVSLAPAHFAANDRAAVLVAQGIYDEEAFDRMPILADALEEAGCVEERILRHCREPGVHVRGCWVVDLVFGRV